MRDWYYDWMNDHMAAFGISDEASIAAFTSWEEVLAVSLCATPDELREVTRLTLMQSPTPRWPTDQFDAIKKNLAGVKTKAMNALALSDDDYEARFGVCTLCSNAGLVVVPHPRYVKPDEGWVPYRFNTHGDPLRATAGVYCKCQKGRELFANALAKAGERNRPKPLDITRYEEMVTTQWRDMLAYEELRKRHVAQARPERNPHPELRGG